MKRREPSSTSLYRSRRRALILFLKIHILPVLAAVLLKIVFHLVRWVRNDLKALQLTREPMIGAFWHGRQLMLAPLFADGQPSFPVSMLISSHADGQLIAKAVGWFGISAIYGSSSRNGGDALRKMVSALEDGSSVAITPDGPRGPVHEVKPGVIKISSISGKKILPISYSASAYWQFRSWDRMILPKPFSKGVCMVGTPIVVPPGLSEYELATWQATVEHELNALNDACDAFFKSRTPA